MFLKKINIISGVGMFLLRSKYLGQPIWFGEPTDKAKSIYQCLADPVRPRLDSPLLQQGLNCR